jgi:hypothetical protein
MTTLSRVDEPMVSEKPKALSVKLHMDIVESARIVTAYRNESMTDMLSNLLRPILAKMEQEEVAKRRNPPKAKGGLK